MILLAVSALPVFLFCCFLLLVLYAQYRLIKLYYSRRMALREQERLQIDEDYRRQLLAAVIQSQESERKRIATDLQDGISPLLSVVKFQLDAIQEKGPHHMIPLVAGTIQLMDEVLVEMRHIVDDMTPFSLQLIGLKGSLKELLMRLERSRQISTRFQYEQENSGLTLEQELMVYRVMAELLDNTIRHAKASHLQLVHLPEADGFSLKLLHNGAGLRQEEFERLAQQSAGLGLKNILGRLQVGNGRILYEKMTAGYSVTISIPIQNNSQLPPVTIS